MTDEPDDPDEAERATLREQARERLGSRGAWFVHIPPPENEPVET